MIINTKWFGEIETEESKIFTFENGIIGFSDFKKYAIVGAPRWWATCSATSASSIPMW